jgi:hypothetical protein
MHRETLWGGRRAVALARRGGRLGILILRSVCQLLSTRRMQSLEGAPAMGAERCRSAGSTAASASACAAGWLAAQAGEVAARFRETGLARVASGAACTGLHAAMSSLLLVVGFCSRDAASLAVATAAAGTILVINALLHNCPLTVMEEERWGVSGTRAWTRWAEAMLGVAPGDAYGVQLQYIVICCSLLLVRLLLMALRRSGADVVRVLDALL